MLMNNIDLQGSRWKTVPLQIPIKLFAKNQCRQDPERQRYNATSNILGSKKCAYLFRYPFIFSFFQSVASDTEYMEQDTTKLLSPINEKTGLFSLKKSSSDVLLDMTKHLNLFLRTTNWTYNLGSSERAQISRGYDMFVLKKFILTAGRKRGVRARSFCTGQHCKGGIELGTQQIQHKWALCDV